MEFVGQGDSVTHGLPPEEGEASVALPILFGLGTSHLLPPQLRGPIRPPGVFGNVEGDEDDVLVIVVSFSYRIIDRG